MRKTTIALLLTISVAIGAQQVAPRADYRVVPLPTSVQTDTTQVFTLQSGMGIAFDEKLPAMERNAKFLCQWVEELTGIRLQLAPGSKKAAIRLTLDLPTPKGQEREPECSAQHRPCAKACPYAHRPTVSDCPLPSSAMSRASAIVASTSTVPAISFQSRS